MRRFVLLLEVFFTSNVRRSTGTDYFVAFLLQFRENVAAWVCFHDKKEEFKGFLWRVLRLKEEVRFSFFFHVLYLVFDCKYNSTLM